ncbi:uncharacterized protein DUF2490 [Pontibacter ummariensis]|uniref:DUF2490 domain-containing protein n=1 Tax=Pontibacter ummariensis TaxID=1610492 RepID=A0A239B190_9BACT|nr:DUF2490 domain-containing protein [Pontibacter ummariensis]PRY16243.1 uncharacterized protein DUF2490 [Pontibacter ummariensis]SNS01726.1 Protein of unknown function [Pontibacter ummariensis]
MKKLYLLFLLSLPLLAEGQSKVRASLAIWPEWQVDYRLGEEGLLFFRNQYRMNTDSRYNGLRPSGLLGNFERIELSLGYEHAFSEHWRGGALVRYAAENYPKATFYALFLRHQGHISSLYFNKQFLFDYVRQEEQDPYGRFRLMAELGKRLPLKNKFITPVLSFEMMLLSEFGQEGGQRQEERAIDRTRLRLGVNYELTDKLRLNPYVMGQTNYYYVLIAPVYDEAGQLLEEGYTTKRNRLMPVVGVEVKYSIHQAPTTAGITY